MSRLVVLVGPVAAAKMEAQASGSVQTRNVAFPQIRLHDCPRNRLRHCKEPSCGLRRSHRRRCRPLTGLKLRLGSRHAEEGPGLVGDILEVEKAAALAD